jgi:hypothetical protein
MLMIPHCLCNRLIDGGKIVSPTHWLPSTLEKHYFFYSGAHFCLDLSKPQGLVRPEGLGKFKHRPIGYRTRDLPVCSIVVPASHFRFSPFRNSETYFHSTYIIWTFLNLDKLLVLISPN